MNEKSLLMKYATDPEIFSELIKEASDAETLYKISEKYKE